ncbi:cytochrome b [Tahibacter amnicola]|uniref:Cytochrome b/b6 domain-containing protein n=1 Tax=Tahibacter amnicola TaxID=2976241 RepID=A0ABY6BEL2_9GAMM|nr:cytochrome b/b6 domain-containing protein [Tahibacter amnicola]UXI68184.1 cytochrome b/b6 domain-containing protein [Tahibacter amnicola]
MIVEPAAPRERHTRLLRWLHWLSAVLVVAASVLAEIREFIPRGVPVRAALMQWHMATGLALLALYLPRVAARLLGNAPAAPPEAFAGARQLERLLHGLIYGVLLVQPLLGLAAAQAAGRTITLPLVSAIVPALPGIGGAWEGALENAHSLLGRLFYGLIALHVGAALWHHLVRRDATLRRML